MAEAPEVPEGEVGEAKPEVHGEDEIVKRFLYRLVCQLCDKNFEEDISIACVHFTYCRSCRKENGLPDDLVDDMVCTQCSEISVRRNQQLDSTLSLMHRNAIKYRRGLQENRGQPDVHLLSQHISAVNIRDDDSEGFLDSSLPAAEQSPPVSVPDVINSSDSSQSESESESESRSDSPHGSTSSSTSSRPGSLQPTQGGTTRCTPIPGMAEPGCNPSPGRSCKTCDLVTDVSTVTGPSGKIWNVEGNFTCKSSHVIYYINCTKCSKPYVGQTKQVLSSRISQHLFDIEKKKPSSGAAKHFINTPELTHSVEKDFEVCVLKSFHPSTSTKTIWKMEQDMMTHLGTKEPSGLNER